MVELAVTLGIVFSLMFIEVFGIAAGGIVIPGYIALQLHKGDENYVRFKDIEIRELNK